MTINFTVKGAELTSELEKYAKSKATRLAHRIPRRQRASANCRVSFAQTTKNGVKQSTCSVDLILSGTELRAEETTQHMYAALDIAVVHIDQQLKDLAHRKRRRLIRRFHSNV